MDICAASRGDSGQLARFLWLNSSQDQQAERSAEDFAADLVEWWDAHQQTHFAFVARRTASELVGMAWLALVPRVPRPGLTARRSADVQSVFVLPEHRGRGTGAALIRAAYEYAVSRGAIRVTVSSGRRAVPLYEKLGFSSSSQLLQLEPDDG